LCSAYIFTHSRRRAHKHTQTRTRTQTKPVVHCIEYSGFRDVVLSLSSPKKIPVVHYIEHTGSGTLCSAYIFTHSRRRANAHAHKQNQWCTALNIVGSGTLCCLYLQPKKSPWFTTSNIRVQGRCVLPLSSHTQNQWFTVPQEECNALHIHLRLTSVF
jgi:hypothetical protein